jgi:hypothetical protein
MNRPIAQTVLTCALFCLCVPACAPSTTETGYEPRRLGMSDGQRRALYAPKYSPEQAQAQAERDQEARKKPGASLGNPY